MKRIYLSVINDLVTDQRIHRVALTLYRAGADVTLIGRRFRYSKPVSGRTYRVKRIRLIFNHGFLFYACFNIRLVLMLMFKKKGILVANDLDTLPANFIVSLIRKMPLVYDSHEYFTEVPELIGRHFVRNTWLRIEKYIVPRLKYAYTVSESIASEYRKKYGTDFRIIKNLPFLQEGNEHKRPDLLQCEPQRIIIYQGSLNPGRGLEVMISTMRYLHDFIFQVFGDGPLKKKLIYLTEELGLNERVYFMGRISFDELKFYTRQASIGISLEENVGKNYYFALPNKLFDYIHAQVPVLVSGLPEMKKIVEEYNIGVVAGSLDPKSLAGIVSMMMNEHEQRIVWGKNLRIAAMELCWEKQEGILLEIYISAGLDI